MIAAIMQPYFFPYIGYFQLMNEVDTFVMLDDVQYVERSWMNRNRILLDNKSTWITMPVENASRSLPINKRRYILSAGTKNIRAKIEAAYRNAPYRDEVKSILDNVFSFNDQNVANFNANLLKAVADKLGIRCNILFSSKIGNDSHLRSEGRILDLCKKIRATHYINPIGGTALYDGKSFASEGIRLSFLKTTVTPEKHHGSLLYFSIIHDLACGGAQQVKSMLGSFDLITP